MTRPMNRNARIPQLGKLDEEGGEFWVENPFQMPRGGMNLSAYEPNRLFLNLGGLDFMDATFTSGVALTADSRSVVAADFNRDGAPDLLVGSVGGGPLRLFLNRFPPRQGRVQIRLQGVTSNRPGIGARIVAQAGDTRIVRDLFAANPGMGQGPAEWTLGLGDADKIDRLSLRWPSGETQEFKNLPTGVRLTFTEGEEQVLATRFDGSPLEKKD